MSVNAYAIVTTAWKGVYKPRNVFRVQDFSVDSAMDTDTDQWTLTLGDPDADLIDVLKRDNEVRIQIFAKDSKEFQVLQTGFADEVGFDLEGNLKFNGRDMTAAAVDSQAQPNQWDNARPDKIIEKEARQLGIGGKVQIQKTAPFKHIARDGSETYWDFWYRLMRKRSMWLWAEPDGALLGGFLNYDKPVSYKFGAPSGAFTINNPGWIPVQTAIWQKQASERVGLIYVIGHDGEKDFVVHQSDTTISHWLKRPIKIITDSAARTKNQALATAKEEIFDTIVGAVEWQLTIMNSDRLIRQNTIAQVNLPQIGLSGKFFVVGCKTLLDPSEGLYQVVRLREKGYAISKRTPADPDLTGTQGTLNDLGARTGTANINVRWANCFTWAANNHHGPWGFKDFLAVLLAQCDCETGFKNVRSGGTEEHPGIENVPSMVTDPEGWKKFRNNFANHAETPGSGGTERAVGPMQLYSRSYKVAADRLFDPGLVDEFVGGRWNPCSNINEAAIVLRGFAKSFEAGSQVPLPIDQIWGAVGAYNGGPDWASKAESRKYVECVKGKFPGYLSMVEGGISEGQAAAATAVTDSAARNKIAEAASYFVSIEPRVHYTQTSRRMQIVREKLKTPLPSGKEIYEDCSSFVTGLYFIAGASDPNGNGYNGSGNTDSLQQRGESITIGDAKPGDLVFYINPDHVAVYIGGNNVISHGTEGGPLVARFDYRDLTAVRSYING